MTKSESPFWADARGDSPPPPAAKLPGWKVLEAMLDDTLNPALATTFEPNEFAPTLELKINFVSPARPGVILGAGRVVHRGKSVAFLEGELRDADVQWLATACATAKLV